MAIYSQIGSRFQREGGRPEPGDIKMNGPRPGPNFVAQADGTWAEATAPPEPRVIDGAKISTATRAELDGANTTAQLAAVVKKILVGTGA